jgi:flavorubredoxin
MDLAREDIFTGIAKAFAYENLIIASPTYNMGIFPFADRFLQGLVDRNYQNRNVGIIENGTWAPAVIKKIKEKLVNSKDIRYFENSVSIKSALNDESLSAIQALLDEIK